WVLRILSACGRGLLVKFIRSFVMRKDVLGMMVSCALAAGGTGGGGSGSHEAGSDDPEALKVEVYEWLGDGRGKMAMDSLLLLLRERVPDIQFVGPQYDTLDPPAKELPLRIAAGNPPDSFQSIGGGDLGEWAQKGALAPLDALAADQGWATVFPE